MWNLFKFTTLKCKGSGLIFFGNCLLSTWSLMFKGICNVCQYKIVLNNCPCSTISLEIDPLMQRLMARVMENVHIFLIPPLVPTSGGRESRRFKVGPIAWGWAKFCVLAEISGFLFALHMSFQCRSFFATRWGPFYQCIHGPKNTCIFIFFSF